MQKIFKKRSNSNFYTRNTLQREQKLKVRAYYIYYLWRHRLTSAQLLPEVALISDILVAVRLTGYSTSPAYLPLA